MRSSTTCLRLSFRFMVKIEMTDTTTGVHLEEIPVVMISRLKKIAGASR